MDQNEIASDRTIDPGELDVEAVKQADLYCKWAERSAAAKGEADKLEFAADVLEAQLQLQCRNDPDKFGLTTSVTEPAIKAAIKCHPKYIAAVEAFHRARLEASLLDRAEKAMGQKKNMIEELVKLHGQQYFAGPSVPRNIIAAWQEHQQSQREGVNDKLRGTVRKRVRTGS